MATNRSLRLLRSKETYKSFDEAKAAINQIKRNKDGEMVIAHYESSPADAPVKTHSSAIGIYDRGSWTVFKNVADRGGDIDAIQAELDATQAGAGLEGDGSYVKPVDGQPGFEILGGDGAPDNLKAAIMKVADLIASMGYNNNYTPATSGEEAEDAHPTDYSLVISGVQQENGVLDAVTTETIHLGLKGYENDGRTHVGAITANDTVLKAFNKVETATKISPQAGNQLRRITTEDEEGLATKLSIVEVEDTASNVYKAYGLVDLNSNNPDAVIGATIKVYKDSSLTDVFIGHVSDTFKHPIDSEHPTITASYTNKATDVEDGTGDEALCFVYHREDDMYELVAINVETFIQEAEFKKGFEVVGHEVNVKIDSVNNAAGLLTVSQDGIALPDSVVVSITEVASQEVTEFDGEMFINVVKSTKPDGSTVYSVTTQRIKEAVDELAFMVGLSGTGIGERSWLPTSHYGAGNAHSNMEAIVEALHSIDESYIQSVSTVDNEKVISVVKTDAKNPKLSFNLSQNEDNGLLIENDGLYLSNVWDCGQY